MTGAPPPRTERFISASEMGEYASCRRAWWLRAVHGVTTATHGTRFSAGHAAHRRHAWSLWWAHALGWLAALLVAAALAALVWSTWR